MKIIEKNTRITKNYVKMSLVECENCGNIFEIQNTKINKQFYCCKCQKQSSITHNMTNTRFYRIWADVVTRGKNNYIHRKNKKTAPVGIQKSWLKFVNFKKDMYRSYLEQEKKFGTKETTIDRIDNKKGYFKRNCRWATNLEQNRNKSNSISIGEKSLSEISKINNIKYNLVYSRFKKGYTGNKLSRKPTKHYKLFFGKVPLKKYCIDNDINYQTVTSRIHRGKSILEALKFNL